MKMIESKRVLKTLADTDLVMPGETEPMTVGKSIAFILQGYRGKVKVDPMKLLELARRFYKEDETELDNSDFVIVKDIIKENQIFTPLVLGQLLEEFEKV